MFGLAAIARWWYTRPVVGKTLDALEYQCRATPDHTSLSLILSSSIASQVSAGCDLTSSNTRWPCALGTFAHSLAQLDLEQTGAMGQERKSFLLPFDTLHAYPALQLSSGVQVTLAIRSFCRPSHFGIKREQPSPKDSSGWVRWYRRNERFHFRY